MPMPLKEYASFLGHLREWDRLHGKWRMKFLGSNMVEFHVAGNIERSSLPYSAVRVLEKWGANWKAQDNDIGVVGSYTGGFRCIAIHLDFQLCPMGDLGMPLELLGGVAMLKKHSSIAFKIIRKIELFYRNLEFHPNSHTYFMNIGGGPQYVRLRSSK